MLNKYINIFKLTSEKKLFLSHSDNFNSIILWHMLFLMIGFTARLTARGTRYKTNGTELESGKLEEGGKEGSTTPSILESA